MKYTVLLPFKINTPKGLIDLSPGQQIKITDKLAATLIEKGRVTPLESLSVSSWLDKLSDSEREIFQERSAIMQYDGGLQRELAEIEAIKRIIKERIIPGKCDKCDKVNGCMLTKKMRALCEVH